MKPTGPIPPGFATIGGELAIDGQTASALVAAAGGTPLFVYSRTMIAARVAALRLALPTGVAIDYAVKANPHPPLVAFIAGLVDGFDIASAGELALVAGAGVAPARIGFAGPGKRDAELFAAIAGGVTLNLESAREADRALAIGDRLGIAPRLAIRINPDFALGGAGMSMGGGARPFGIDAIDVPPLARRLAGSGCEWRGFHIFAGSQSLNGPAIAAALGAALDLSLQVADAAGVSLPRCTLGGGFGIPYFHGQAALDPGPIGAALGDHCARLGMAIAGTRIAVELGRWLVGEAGVYLTRVIDRKVSHGEIFLVTDGGLHHQLAASGNFGAVVRRNYPCAIATRYAAPADEVAHVAGCLCTPLDRLVDAAALPHADEGDLVALFCAGAYGASASPSRFLGQEPATEWLV